MLTIVYCFLNECLYNIICTTIYQIIQDVVNHFGKEPLNKIIIKDIDTRVKQVMRWTGSNALYQ